MKWKCIHCGSERVFIWRGEEWCSVCDFHWWGYEPDDATA